MNHKLIPCIMLSILVSACATAQLPVPKTPSQAVFELKTAEGAAITIANQYKALPPCPQAVLCSDPQTVLKVDTADKVAREAIDTAESAVRGSISVKDPQSLIDTANLAVTALENIAHTLKVSL